MNLTYYDLFLFFRNSGYGFMVNASLINFVSKEYKLNLSEQSEKNLSSSLRLFCKHLSSRWQKSNRTLETFTKKYKSWLQKIFVFPHDFYSISSHEFASITSLSHNKAFDDIVTPALP